MTERQGDGEGGAAGPRGRSRSRSRSRDRGRGRGRAAGNRWGGADAPTPGSPADEAPDADPESVARGIVLRKLTAAPRTRAQLADDLASRGVPDDVSDRVLDRFTEVGLVDDAAFAEAWVRTRHAGRGLSRRALMHELRRKGVDDETTREAVDVIDADDEERAAAALVARRLPSTAGLPGPTRLRRLVGMLARKGYPEGLAWRVVRAALASESGPVDAVSGTTEPEAGRDDPGESALVLDPSVTRS